MPEEKNVWGIHTKDRLLFLQKKVVAIGWNAIGDLSTLPDSRDAFKERYKNIFPDDKEGHVRISVGMLYRFVHEVKIGDYVIYPSSLLGIVFNGFCFINLIPHFFDYSSLQL